MISYFNHACRTLVKLRIKFYNIYLIKNDENKISTIQSHHLFFIKNKYENKI